MSSKKNIYPFLMEWLKKGRIIRFTNDPLIHSTGTSLTRQKLDVTNLLLRWSLTGARCYLQEQKIRSHLYIDRHTVHPIIRQSEVIAVNIGTGSIGPAMRLIRQKRLAELTSREQPWNRYWVCSCYPCLVTMIIIYRSCSCCNLEIWNAKINPLKIRLKHSLLAQCLIKSVRKNCLT